VNFLSSEILKGTDWRALERGVARFMEHCGWSHVRVIGGSGDKGGDVLGIRQEDGRDKVFVVQVKAVTDDRYVSKIALKEVLNAVSAYGADVGVVATNGDFTPSAYARQKELQHLGFDVRLWNGVFLRDLLARWPEQSPGYRLLRQYQHDIVEQCIERYNEGGKRVQFVVATGLGKTVIAAEVLSRLIKQGLRRALVLCHAQDLALQLEQSFWPQLEKSISTRVFFEGSMPKVYDGVNFGLYQSFSNHLNGIEPLDYEIVIVDEAHHALARGFRSCLTYLQPRFLIGMTATPWRGDGESIDILFGVPVARVSLVDGMQMGFLAQVNYLAYCDTVDWHHVGEMTNGTMTIRDLNKRLFLPQRDEAIVEELQHQCSNIVNPRVIVFCASIEHCTRFANHLSSLTSWTCKPVSGINKIERHRTLAEFAAGKIQAVTAVDVLNEGIDVPDVNTLVFLRSTHSRRVFIQQLGRGLRLSPGKESVLVLDFVSDIRRLADVLTLDRDVRVRANKYQTVYFPNGVVRFMNEGALPFIQQWLNDVADLGDADEAQQLQFPELL
jgi:superfamily II DNA or RNA helicase